MVCGVTRSSAVISSIHRLASVLTWVSLVISSSFGVARILGRLVKVTPSSKVVGDLALHLVGAGVTPADFEADPGRFDIPDSVTGFLHGELGDPPGGWPEPFRSKALAGRAKPKGIAELTGADEDGLRTDRRRTLNRLLFPGP